MDAVLLLHLDEFLDLRVGAVQIPMLAPRRVPPCFTVSVAMSKTLHEGERARGDRPWSSGRGRSWAGYARRRSRYRRPLLWMSDGVFDGREDFLHGVAHRQHETGGELLQLAARVHERRGVGQEVPAGKHVVVAVAPDVGGLAGLRHRGVGGLEVLHEPGEIGVALAGFGQAVVERIMREGRTPWGGHRQGRNARR